jgi:glycosyltransferase involved in cell wall biosynthesis
MEALAVQLSVISTAVSRILELIQHEETNLVVLERDPFALATVIIRLCQDKLLAQRLARNGHSLVEGEYDITKNASKLIDLFHDVIEERIV